MCGACARARVWRSARKREHCLRRQCLGLFWRHQALIDQKVGVGGGVGKDPKSLVPDMTAKDEALITYAQSLPLPPFLLYMHPHWRCYAGTRTDRA